MSLVYAELTRNVLGAQRRGVAAWALGLFALGLVTVMVWPAFRDSDALTGFTGALPPQLVDSLGMADMGTPSGYLMGNLYSLIVPVLLAAVGIGQVASTISGDERDGRLETLFAFSVTRATVFLSRFTAAVVAVVLGCAAVFAAAVTGRFFFDLDVSWSGLAAVSLVMVLFAGFHLALAYLFAACGLSRAVSFAAPFAVLVGGYLFRSLVPLVEHGGDLVRLSPWEWALAEDPLNGELSGWGLLTLAGLSAVAVVVGTAVGARRDVHAP